jgi:hypothetical protein
LIPAKKVLLPVKAEQSGRYSRNPNSGMQQRIDRLNSLLRVQRSERVPAARMDVPVVQELLPRFGDLFVECFA